MPSIILRGNIVIWGNILPVVHMLPDMIRAGWGVGF